MAESYSINGTDLATLMEIQRIDGAIHAPTVLQEDYLVPGRTGAIATAPWLGPSPLVFYGVVTAANRTLFVDKARTLTRTCFNQGKVSTMTRVLDLPTGGTTTGTASVRYVSGLEMIEPISPRSGRVTIEFTMLSSFWSDDQYTSTQPLSAATFSLSVPGDVTTNEVILEFAGGNNQRLTNTTTGDFVQVNVNTGTTAAVVNVGSLTAAQGSTNIIDKVEVAGYSYGKYWMTLSPGINTFTLSGSGTVKIQYKGAYL